MKSYHLTTEHLDVGYDGKTLIHDICLRIKKGEIVTLIGPNGAGKSTILKSIAGALKHIGGTILLDGHDVLKLSRQELSERMAVMLTDHSKPELLTCRDVVSAGRYPYTGRLGILSASDEQKVEEALTAMRIPEIADRDFNTISDGQRQRVLLARALCQEPEIIILDEPTSFLDIHHKLELLHLLQKMAKEKSITVVMSLHELDLAQKISDRVVCVKGTSIEKTGSPEEIFREDIIRNLYDLESGTYDPLSGSLEMPAPPGRNPEVFVLSSGGGGIPVYRRLQRENRPFAAGILYENDIDYPAARRLACEIVTEKPFEEISEAAIKRARELIEKCDEVIVTGFPIGSMNRRIRELIPFLSERSVL